MLWVVIRPRDRINYLTNRFQVAVRLFSNRSQRTSKCGKNISDTLGCTSRATFLFLPHFDIICDLLYNSDTLGCTSCATFLFLPHFDVICDLLLNRRTATWNLFVLYYKELKYTEKNLFISNFPTLTETKIAFDVIYCL